MRPSSGEIISRGLTGACPKCGRRGLFRHWFRLQDACTHCGLKLGKEDGFYLGTTSIGYVLAILIVLIPVCVLVALDWIGVWTGVAIGILGSLFLVAAMYPIMLCALITVYYLCKPQELDDSAE
ncbi:DUF983 domain-containing protein [Cerasicoccus maritimus]|uniref:DUF983 domain-containing protein n=1 Tax=Cerasicoccus maritimus TaxID=490089 RepID=UPI002852B158|nr:DUF983 domain-containing protein [Cerasicoccus maritimus]